jgi:hypothetical protein
MYVRQANLNDKKRWDSFVDSEHGSFFHYFDWKNIYEAMGRQFIPLLLENDSSELIGILPIVKQKCNLYPSIVSLPEGASGGCVIKKNLDISEKNKAITCLLDYVNKNFSRGCTTFDLNENLITNDKNPIQPSEILLKNGFEYKYNSTQLPCTYILELEQPFEDRIWNELWDHRLKNKIRNSQKKGVYIKEDKSLKYSNEFFNMLVSTYIRLGSPPLSKEEALKRATIFADKTKLFVALLNEEPLASMLCYYQSSICYLSKLPSYVKAREYDANSLLAFEAIRNACENGYKYCEFGVTILPAQTRWKEQFKGIKIPLRRYEKKYSTIRTIVAKESEQLKWLWSNKQYVWKNRYKFLRKAIRKEC